MEAYQQLEHELGRWCGRENVVACASGTAALHLALESFRLPPGSEVILPDFTMVACARAVSMAGLTPVFADCEGDGNLDPDMVRKAFTGRTTAVLAVHVYGRRCAMEALSDFTRSKGLCLIEDCAEYHGGTPHRLSDAWCWSFYRNKIVAGEEGGAVAFREPGPAGLARSLRSLGFTPQHDFYHVPRGHNYRMANCLASKVLGSLRMIASNLELRRDIEARYDGACPPDWRRPPREVPWVYDLRVRDMSYETQGRVVDYLRGAGIQARSSFKPMSRQAEYSPRAGGPRRVTRPGLEAESMADVLARELLYLPIVPLETRAEDVQRSFDLIHELIHEGLRTLG